MKQFYITFLLTVLMSMVGAMTFAHDIEVKNDDGVTIYYIFINDNTELAVSCRGNRYDDSEEYSGKVVIPKSVTYNGKTYRVTSIGGYTFYGCSGLTSVTIPNSVTSIGDYAFQSCSGLTSIEIPSSVKSIGYKGFDDCTGLKKVIARDIAAWCSINIDRLSSSSPLYYAHHLYSDENTEIKDLIIPKGVTTIGENAFAFCTSLTSVTIPNSVTSIGVGAFEHCTGLTSLTIGNSVTSIGGSAFYDCRGLTSVEIPNSVTSIGAGAFYECTGLTSATIGNSVTSIGSKAFAGCTGLTSVTIPNSVTSIANYAFNQCTGLTSVTIGNSVTSIGDYAFQGCTGLTSVTIPNSVTSIGSYAFAYCRGLTSVTIPNSVTSIVSYTFYECNGLASVTIPNSVTSIGSHAFQGCSGLVSITIPNGVTTVENSTFSGCKGLKSITIGSGVTHFGDYAFDDVSPYKVIWLPNTPPYGYNVRLKGSINYVANDLYRSLYNKTVYPFLSSMFEVDGVKYVPVSPSERTCDAIDCTNNEMVKNMRISSTVSYRGVDMTVKNIAPYFCCGNPFVENLEFDLTDGTINAIPQCAFIGCSSLKNVTIPDVIESLGDFAFSDCTGLTSVTIPNGVTSTGYGTFSGCTGLTSVDIQCKEIGSCFSGLPIKKITFGEEVESIGAKAFSGCTAVTKIISMAKTPPACGTQALDDINKWDCVLSVPQGSLSAYQAAEQWKEFFFIDENATGIGSLTTDPSLNGDGCYYTIDGRKLQGVPTQKGVYIVNGRTVVIK